MSGSAGDPGNVPAAGQTGAGRTAADRAGDGPGHRGASDDGPADDGAIGPDATVECVAGGGGRASLIAVGPSGPKTWLEFAVRPVPAYRRASVAVWVLAVLAAAFALHPLVAPWPPAGRAGMVLAMAVAGRLLVAAVADAVWTRLVESLVLDGVQAVLEAGSDGSLPPLSTSWGPATQPENGPDRT